ncbi:MAG: hypothetical protein AAF658_14730, partial [Myxococcota bacterium]
MLVAVASDLKTKRTAELPVQDIRGFSFSKSGRYVLVFGYREKEALLSLWDARAMKELWRRDGVAYFAGAAVTHDERSVIAVFANRPSGESVNVPATVAWLDLTSGKRRDSFVTDIEARNGGRITASPSGPQGVMVGLRHQKHGVPKVMVIDWSARRLQHRTVLWPASARIGEEAFSADGRFLAVSGDGTTVYDLTRGTDSKFDTPPSVIRTRLAMNRFGRLIAPGARLDLDLATLTARGFDDVPVGEAPVVAEVGGPRFFVGGWRHVIEISGPHARRLELRAFNAKEQELLAPSGTPFTFNPLETVFALDLHPNGRSLLVANGGNQAVVVDTETFEVRKHNDLNAGGIWWLGASAERTLVAGDGEGRYGPSLLFDLRNDTLTRTRDIKGSVERTYGAPGWDLHPRTGELIVPSVNGGWVINLEDERRELGRPASVARFSADGRRLALVSDDAMTVVDGTDFSRELCRVTVGSGDEIVAWASDSRWVLAGELARGGLGFFDGDTCERQARLFADGEGEWALVWEDGFYAASRDGAQLLVYAAGAQALPGRALDLEFNRPDLIA